MPEVGTQNTAPEGWNESVGGYGSNENGRGIEKGSDNKINKMTGRGLCSKVGDMLFTWDSQTKARGLSLIHVRFLTQWDITVNKMASPVVFSYTSKRHGCICTLYNDILKLCFCRAVVDQIVELPTRNFNSKRSQGTTILDDDFDDNSNFQTPTFHTLSMPSRIFCSAPWLGWLRGHLIPIQMTSTFRPISRFKPQKFWSTS